MYKLIIIAVIFSSSYAFNEFEFVEKFCEESEPSCLRCSDFSFSEDDLKDFAERLFTISKATDIKLNGDIKLLNEYLFEKFPEAKIFELENNESISYELSKPYTRPSSNWKFESKIHTLILGNGKVDSLEDSTSLHALVELETLQISFSKSKDRIKVLKIDDSFLEQNTKLKNLTIDTSNIAEITERAFEKNNELQTLILRSNQLSHFEPNTFKYQTKLTTMNLADNDIQYLSPGYFWPSSMVTLNLSVNKVETITKNHFKNLLNLKYLDMSFNNIRVLSRNAFESNTKLETINLRNNRIEKIVAFRNLAMLVSLDVSNNAVNNMQGNLFGNCRSLRTLNVRNNTVRILYAAFNPELISLDLSLNKIAYLQGFEFNENTSLKYLNLSSNSLKRMGFSIAAIKEGTFDDLVELEELHLENNFLENDDIFRNLLKSLVKLERFYLKNNGALKFEDNVFDDLVSLEYLDYDNLN